MLPFLGITLFPLCAWVQLCTLAMAIACHEIYLVLGSRFILKGASFSGGYLVGAMTPASPTNYNRTYRSPRVTNIIFFVQFYPSLSAMRVVALPLLLCSKVFRI